MHLRTCTPADAQALGEIYRDAVLHLGPQAYTAEQTRVWASRAEPGGRFYSAIGQGLVLCAQVEAKPVAFGQLHPADHIGFLYCHSAHARQGYASAILAELESAARAAGSRQITVEASLLARPLFERHSYTVLEEQRPTVSGIELVRYKMVKTLGDVNPAGD